MKLTTTVARQINTTLELGVSSMRAVLGAEPPIVAPEIANCPTAGLSIVNRAAGLDARLDAIRRAGL